MNPARLFAVLLGLVCATARADVTPDVSEIIGKLIARGEDRIVVEARNSFAYQRTSTVDYLAQDGSVKKTSVRLYEVRPENGEPITKLISINGRPAKEEDDKRRSKARETGDKSRSLNLSEDLLSRFVFSYLREESVGERATWVLAFSPKPDATRDGLFDRLVGAMAGTLWVDQEDHQLAKVDIHLVEKISFLGGIAGAIDRMNMTIIQRRVEPEVWLGEAISIDFSGRKVLAPVRLRCFEACSGFRRMNFPQDGSQSMSKLSPDPSSLDR